MPRSNLTPDIWHLAPGSWARFAGFRISAAAAPVHGLVSPKKAPGPMCLYNLIPDIWHLIPEPGPAPVNDT